MQKVPVRDCDELARFAAKYAAEGAGHGAGGSIGTKGPLMTRRDVVLGNSLIVTTDPVNVKVVLVTQFAEYELFEEVVEVLASLLGRGVVSAAFVLLPSSRKRGKLIDEVVLHEWEGVGALQG